MVKKASRTEILRQKLGNSNNKDSTVTQPVPPTLPSDNLDEGTKAGIQARLTASKLKEQLDIAGLNVAEFLTNELEIQLTQSQRVIKTPYGSYNAVCTHLSYQDLVDKCVIDPENVRDASERTEEALSDIIDEIGEGYQLQAAIAYIDENGKISFVEGSRRRDSAIFREVGLDVEILGQKPSSAATQWMVGASDNKKAFSYYDKGQFYSNLMNKKGWKQSELVRNTKYTAVDVSRCFNFYNNTPVEIKEYLDVKSCTRDVVDTLNKVLAIVVSHKAMNELIAYIESESVRQGDNKAIAALVKSFSKKLTTPKARARVKHETVFERGDVKVEFIKSSKAKGVIELKHLKSEDEMKIMELISDYLNSSTVEES